MSYDVQQTAIAPLTITRTVPIPTLGTGVMAFQNIEATKAFAIVAQPMPTRRIRIKQIGGTWLDV